jgi:hypothetical protein
VENFTPHGAFATLLAEIEAGVLDRAMAEKFGIDFPGLPRLVTVRQTSVAHEGRPHTDSASKVATLLLYMHHGWVSPEGCIRVLRRESLADPVAEMSPRGGQRLCLRPVRPFLARPHALRWGTPGRSGDLVARRGGVGPEEAAWPAGLVAEGNVITK